MSSDNLMVPLLNTFQDKVHENAMAKGFWDELYATPDLNLDRVLPNKLAEIADEVSEARRAHRNGEDALMVAGELADVIIRALDCISAMGIHAAPLIVKKHALNLDRPRLHGRLY